MVFNRCRYRTQSGFCIVLDTECVIIDCTVRDNMQELCEHYIDMEIIDIFLEEK